MTRRDPSRSKSEPVLFRIDRDGDLFAIFPNIPDTGGVAIATRHGWTNGPIAENMRMSRAASPSEYAGMKADLERSMGEKLIVKKRSSTFRRKRSARDHRFQMPAGLELTPAEEAKMRKDYRRASKLRALRASRARGTGHFQAPKGMRDAALVPRGATKPRTISDFMMEVKALLFSRGFGPYKIDEMLLANCPIVHQAWRQLKPPCAVADFFSGKLARRDPSGKRAVKLSRTELRGWLEELFGRDASAGGRVSGMQTPTMQKFIAFFLRKGLVRDLRREGRNQFELTKAGEEYLRGARRDPRRKRARSPRKSSSSQTVLVVFAQDSKRFGQQMSFPDLESAKRHIGGKWAKHRPGFYGWKESWEVVINDTVIADAHRGNVETP